MQELSQFIRIIIILSFVEMVGTMLVPRGNMKKYVRFICGIIVLCMMVETLLPLAQRWMDVRIDGDYSQRMATAAQEEYDYTSIFDAYKGIFQE